ncbi:HAMP domain-containing histidine kinase [Arthrobacter sp. KBS0703]|uniref:sensor histidine kinase n=1 Tax=Arthrobacter sp. KBS0703 TaxID=1955698 RepID=UPI00098EEA9F|nr:HAMP domain-containing sensor histidine kinase [Arthrobacter sp. KBS0703]TSE17604.1 HAMP domain-containing histidine kinase [Arthrobacter sp. KBS0703]
MTPSAADRRILRAAARKVSTQIALVCAAALAVVIVALVLFALFRSQPAELAEHPAGTGRIYIDEADALLALILGGVLAVVLAAAAGLISARSAVKPLGEALAAQRRFVQDASHELRTPLAILDARLQLAQRKAGPNSAAAPTLARLREDSAGLAELVEDLLLMSVATAGETAEPVNATAIVADVADDFGLLTSSAAIQLDYSATGEARVRVPAHLLRRMVTALLDNAISHTPQSGRIGVSVDTAGRTVRISVRDTGPGITGISPDRIFDRFARGLPADHEPARQGYGIGLALVKDAALRHGGDVRVAGTGPDGTSLCLELPAA